VVSEEKIFFKSTNQKQELPVVAIFVNGSERKKDQTNTNKNHNNPIVKYQSRKLISIATSKDTDVKRWSTNITA
jgi:hypothetical protein